MLFALAVAAAGCRPSSPRALEIRGFALTVSDLDRAVAFYEQALGFSKVGERARRRIADHDYSTGIFGTRVRSATLQLGDERIELEQYLRAGRSADPAGQPLQRPVVPALRGGGQRHGPGLRARAPASRSKPSPSAPQTIPESNNGAAAGIKAYKFKDPDGHPLELL